MDCIQSAARHEPKDVYLVYRRSYSQMPAESDERIEAQEAGIHFMLLNQPIDYVVDKKNRLKGLKLVRTRLGEPDDSGRRRPVEIKGSEWVMDADVVIEAIGKRARDDSPDWWFRRFRTAKWPPERSKNTSTSDGGTKKRLIPNLLFKHLRS